MPKVIPRHLPPALRLKLIQTPTTRGPMAHLLIDDSFTDDDSTPIEDHEIAPTNIPDTEWAVGIGDVEIQSNTAKNVPPNISMLVCDPGAADVQINAYVLADATQAPWGMMGLLARYADTNNYWVALIGGAGGVTIQERTGGSTISRATTSFSATVGVERPISVTVQATTIRITAEGYSASYSLMDTGLTNTTAGIRFVPSIYTTAMYANDFHLSSIV